MTENEAILFAFMLTTIAGLSTGFGSFIALKFKNLNSSFLSFSLGLSAGVMIYVSFVEMFKISYDSFAKIHSPFKAELYTVMGFFAGMLLIALIDKMIPKSHNPHEINTVSKEEVQKKNLLRTGLFTAIALAIHNFPEGFATLLSGYQSVELGISVAVAVAIHNIPEGIAVSVPIYYATGSKKKAFIYSFLSGLAEPIGAIVGFLFLRNYMSEDLYAGVFAAVAGIMIFISLDELLPTAEKYGNHHYSIYGVVLGMALMAVSLLVV